VSTSDTYLPITRSERFGSLLEEFETQPTQAQLAVLGELPYAACRQGEIRLMLTFEGAAKHLSEGRWGGVVVELDSGERFRVEQMPGTPVRLAEAARAVREKVEEVQAFLARPAIRAMSGDLMDADRSTALSLLDELADRAGVLVEAADDPLAGLSAAELESLRQDAEDAAETTCEDAWIGKRVRDSEGREMTVTEVSWKDDQLVLDGDGDWWCYAGDPDIEVVE
jgi:hypothetical protein